MPFNEFADSEVQRHVVDCGISDIQSLKILFLQSEDNRKRKRARFSDLEVVTFEYIALGTAVGSVIVYDSISGEVISNLVSIYVFYIIAEHSNDEFFKTRTHSAESLT